MLLCVFFFKQKTAYDMLISDWSADVCSSDLGIDGRCLCGGLLGGGLGGAVDAGLEVGELVDGACALQVGTAPRPVLSDLDLVADLVKKIGRESCRERACQ